MTEILGIVTMGLLIETGGVRMLTDPFSCLPESHFPVISEEDLRAIAKGEPPYDRIDLLLISHRHKDHFHPAHAADMLEHNPGLQVVGPPCVISMLEGKAPSSQLHAVWPELYGSETLSLCGVTIQVARTLHSGKPFGDVEHLAYLIMGDHNVLFAGDAAASQENFGPFGQGEVDLLIGTFPFITTPTNRTAVKTHLQPKGVLVVHLPRYEGEGKLWTDQALLWRDKLREQGWKVDLFQERGDRLVLP